ncbi:IS66 family insertion sequence element accessory protein TnpB [Mesorhizobium sp. M0698]|uniref:IS66 family insertion sequence element accessory protein TnpB n=1 Tax=Mesorhizobium sp. M0698 TaxID=2956987 RepID=UPI00333C32C1
MDHTDMRKGLQGLACLQQHLSAIPTVVISTFSADAPDRWQRSSGMADRQIGMSLYAKRLEKARFIWPQTKDGAVSLTSAQLASLLGRIHWRNLQYSWRPASAG